MDRPLQFLARAGRSAASMAFSALLIAGIVGCNGAVAGGGERVRLVLTPVATPTQTAPAAATAAPVTYTVKAGDTLWDIANLFGVTLDDIVRSNNIADPSALSEGQVLTIPVRPPTTEPERGTGTETAGGTPTTDTGGQPVLPVGSVTPPGPTVSPTLPPPDATPPQGPPVDEPEGDSGAAGPTASPTNFP